MDGPVIAAKWRCRQTGPIIQDRFRIIGQGVADRYLTMVYQIDKGCRRLLWIGRGRTKKSFRPFFTWFGTERCAKIQFFCTDMWKPYLDLIAKHAPNALNVLDRFHLVAKLGLDEITNDSKLLMPAIVRMRQSFGAGVAGTVVTDRGFASAENDAALIVAKVANATLPRNPEDMQAKLLDPVMRKLQRRRAQTEARIGIFKNKFGALDFRVGRVARASGHEIESAKVKQDGSAETFAVMQVVGRTADSRYEHARRSAHSRSGPWVILPKCRTTITDLSHRISTAASEMECNPLGEP